MKKQRPSFRWILRLVMMLGATLMGIGLVHSQASAADIPDISEWQGKLTSGQVSALKSQVSFVINRRQYGSNYQDLHASNNTSLYVKYGIPFGEYDYATFSSAAGAKAEAQTFYNRSNKNAKFYVLDFESTSMSASAANDAAKAWYTEMRSLTSKKLIFYSYQSFATTYANSARQSFDAQWIANYSYKPTISFALWQYTDSHYQSALNEYIDNSKAVTSVHPITWWTAAANALKPNATTPATTTTTKPAANTNSTTTTKPATTTTVTPAAVKYAYSSYAANEHVYLHKGAKSYDPSAKLSNSDTQKFYKVTATKSVTDGKSKQVVYLSGLNKWVPSQYVSGYWVGQHGSYQLSKKVKVYSDNARKHATGATINKGTIVSGKLVNSGKIKAIKTSKGYITANTEYSRPGYYEKRNSSRTVTIKSGKSVYSYSKSNFTRANRKTHYKAGKRLTVTAIKKRSTGSRYFKLSTGKYITASKAYVTE